VGKKTGVTLMGVGVFLLVMGVLSGSYAYDRLAVVPLNQDTVSYSEGPDATVFDVLTREEVDLDLLSTRNVTGDVEASKAASDDLGRDVAVWETLVYTDEPGATISEEDPPRSASHDRVAFDRHTGEAVECCDTYTSSSADLESGEETRDTSTPITGLYFKFPFNTQKETYTFWDGSLKDSTPIEYKETEVINGLSVYRFEQVIEPTKVSEINAPASFFGIDEEGEVTLDRVYANTRTLWIEPETGVIIRGQEQQHVVAEHEGDEVATLTDVTIGYNDETISGNVEKYGALSTLLKVVRVWLPIGGGVIGGVLLLLGLVLLLRSRAAAASA
jgi:Porin PorA